MMARSCRKFAIAHGAQLPTQGLLGNRDAERLPNPLRQIDQPPADNPMHRRDRPALDDRRQRLTLRIVQLRWLAGSLAVHEPIGTPGIEPQHPVANRLRTNVADPRRITPGAAVVNFSQRQKPSGMPAIPHALGELPQTL